jgi:dTDP-4-amino-4,6-dideoxygalactose transaminase
MASDVGAGDEVITTPFTFFATGGAIARVGATPVFADIAEEGFTIDASAAVALITPRTRAIVPVHLFGQCAAMDPILDACRGTALNVIEDCAQAIDATSMGIVAGAHGDFGCFSFFPSKNLGACGDGGLVVARDLDRAARVERLRSHGRVGDRHDEIGINSRLDAIQAAILKVKLAHLADWTRARRICADRYRALFAAAELSDVVVPRDDPGHVYHQFTIRTPRRDALARHLRAQGIATAVYYPVPLHLQPCFAKLGYLRGAFPRAERAADEVLSLPMFPELSVEQQERVAVAMRTFFRGHG